METRKMLRRTLSIGLATSMLCFALVAETHAQGPQKPRMRPGAGLGMVGYVLEYVDVANRKLTVAGKVYDVTSSSRLLDGKGQRISLSQLRGVDSHGSGDMVKITSRRGGSGHEVSELSIVDMGNP